MASVKPSSQVWNWWAENKGRDVVKLKGGISDEIVRSQVYAWTLKWTPLHPPNSRKVCSDFAKLEPTELRVVNVYYETSCRTLHYRTSSMQKKKQKYGLLDTGSGVRFLTLLYFCIFLCSLCWKVRICDIIGAFRATSRFKDSAKMEYTFPLFEGWSFSKWSLFLCWTIPSFWRAFLRFCWTHISLLVNFTLSSRTIIHGRNIWLSFLFVFC